jgi:hypothetical protein
MPYPSGTLYPSETLYPSDFDNENQLEIVRPSLKQPLTIKKSSQVISSIRKTIQLESRRG